MVLFLSYFDFDVLDWFLVCMAVSRFLAKPIQMNFAENKS